MERHATVKPSAHVEQSVVFINALVDLAIMVVETQENVGVSILCFYGYAKQEESLPR